MAPSQRLTPTRQQRLTGGNHPLNESAWVALTAAFKQSKEAKLDTNADFVKHILTKHDGGSETRRGSAMGSLPRL